MRITIHSAIDIEGTEIRQSAVLPYDLAKQIISPIAVTDVPVLAMTLGEEYQGSDKLQQRYALRKDAVDTIAKELAKQLIGHLESRDTLNGYPLDNES